MPDLNFRVEGAEVARHAAAPLLLFKLGIADAAKESGVPIHSVALRCQVRIEPARRTYQPTEQEKLVDLFAEPARWGQTLRPMLWTHTGVQVAAFVGHTVVDLPVPCSFDFTLAATKYFDALEDGEVPLLLLLTGTIFYEGEDGGLRVAQIAWDKEAHFRLSVSVWREMMDHYYPNCAWLCLRRDVFDRLYAYKREHGIPTWEQALERLLPTK